MSGIEKTRIITRPNLMQAYMAMFLEEPHRVTRSTAGMRDAVTKKSIFAEDHRLEPYYLSAYALYRLEFLFRNQSIPPAFKAARHHVLFAFRMLVNPVAPPARANSRDMERYCAGILPTLWSATDAEKTFRDAVEIVGKLANWELGRDSIRISTFTDKIKNHFRPPPARSG